MGRKSLSRRSFLRNATLTAGAAWLTTHNPAAIAASINPLVPLLPRKETLYFAGQQWGPINGWNPYSDGMNNAMAVAQQDSARVVVYETPYMYNMLDGKQYPLLADGAPAWNPARTELTFKIKAAAHWSDGTAVTAEDVAYTWATNKKYQTTAGIGFQDYIDTILASDPQTVVVKAALDGLGRTINPLQVLAYISSNYVVQKAWTQKLEARSAFNADMLKSDLADDFVASGPYGKFINDATIVVYARNDNYWGKDLSMWGKLPSPKYLAHTIFPDNETSYQALLAGAVDVSQAFIPNVEDLWLKDKLPISTYMLEAPYNICATLPTAYFNLKSPGLDQIAIRKAIAIAVNYDAIVANAMSNQSPTFQQVPRSVMNPTTAEQTLFDHDAVKALQWAGNDVLGAKKLLDDAGIKDNDYDGWREYNGQKLSYTAVCPDGWSDWQAAVELIASAGKTIGIEITTLYPPASDYMSVFTDGTQTQYDIFMVWSTGSGMSNPWSRVRQLMSSEFAGTVNNWNGNWGGYRNTTVDAIIAAIPGETNPATLKSLYTLATAAYLTDIPSFTVMYRPQSFYTVNESLWKYFPKANDGKNIPPLDLTDGYGIAGLYNIIAFPHKQFLPAITRP